MAAALFARLLISEKYRLSFSRLSSRVLPLVRPYRNSELSSLTVVFDGFAAGFCSGCLAAGGLLGATGALFFLITFWDSSSIFWVVTAVCTVLPLSAKVLKDYLLEMRVVVGLAVDELDLMYCSGDASNFLPAAFTSLLRLNVGAVKP